MHYLPNDPESLAHDYVDGRNARRNGLTLSDCPYYKLSPNGLRWMEGWADVDHEERAERGGWASKVHVATTALVGEIGRVRLAINAARAAGFPLDGVEDLHDKLLALYRFEE